MMDFLKNPPPGSHHCFFYRTADDLLEILIPYFAAGLSRNELCLWACAPPLGVDLATASFLKLLPLARPEEFLARGQMKILDWSEWYTPSGPFVVHSLFDAESALEKSRALFAEAVARNFSGARVSGNMSWLSPEIWADFMAYEETKSRLMPGFSVVSLCAYPLDRWGAAEILDIVSRHHRAFFRTESGWKPAPGPVFPGEPDHLADARESSHPHVISVSPASSDQSSFSTPHSPRPQRDEIRRFCILALEAHEREKKKIAASLHGSIGELAVAVGAKLAEVESAVSLDRPDLAADRLAETRAALQNEVGKVKRLARAIRPPELDLGDFPETLKAYFGEVARSHNIRFHFEAEPESGPLSLPDMRATMLFRIAHEAFVNAVKHSRAETVRMSLRRLDGRLSLSVEDDGCGFDPERFAGRQELALGLGYMRGMAESLGGSFELVSSPGRGTRIKVLIPLDNPIETKK